MTLYKILQLKTKAILKIYSYISCILFHMCRTLYTDKSQLLFTVLVEVIKNTQLWLFLCYMYVYYGKADMKNVNKKRQKNTAFTFNTKYKLTW